MEKIRRWNTLAVWIAEEMFEARKELREAWDDDECIHAQNRLFNLKDVLEKMKEIEEEIPEPDEN